MISGHVCVCKRVSCRSVQSYSSGKLYGYYWGKKRREFWVCWQRRHSNRVIRRKLSNNLCVIKFIFPIVVLVFSLALKKDSSTKKNGFVVHVLCRRQKSCISTMYRIANINPHKITLFLWYAADVCAGTKVSSIK